MKGHGNCRRFLKTGKKPMSFPSSRRARRKTQVTSQPHLDPREGDGTTNPSKHLQNYEGDDDDWEQLT